MTIHTNFVLYMCIFADKSAFVDLANLKKKHVKWDVKCVKLIDIEMESESNGEKEDKWSELKVISLSLNYLIIFKFISFDFFLSFFRIRYFNTSLSAIFVFLQFSEFSSSSSSILLVNFQIKFLRCHGLNPVK